MYRLDDGEREEKENEEKLDGHLEEREELLRTPSQLPTDNAADVLIRTYHISI